MLTHFPSGTVETFTDQKPLPFPPFTRSRRSRRLKTEIKS